MAGTGSAGTGSAGMVMPGEPASVSSALKAFGYETEVETDDYGDPLIHFGRKTMDMRVVFYECTDGSDCKTLMLFSYMDAPKDAVARVGDWNTSASIGRARLDTDGDVVFDMVLPARAGLPRDSFRHAVEDYESQLDLFFDKLNE